MPPYTAFGPRISSIRSSWLYLAMRSVRLAEPVLIWPVPRATARSAIVVSSVFAGTMAHDSGVAVAEGQIHGFDRLGQGADLVDLHQDAVGHALIDSHLQPLAVVTNRSSPTS